MKMKKTSITLTRAELEVIYYALRFTYFQHSSYPPINNLAEGEELMVTPARVKSTFEVIGKGLDDTWPPPWIEQRDAIRTNSQEVPDGER